MKPVIEIKSDEVEVSDGYHTFTELYDHRVTLFIALCRLITMDLIEYENENGELSIDRKKLPWRSKKHSDGSEFEGWFIMGIGKEPGKQISYHLPVDSWDETDFAETLEQAPEFDGHTPQDVIQRLKNL